VSYAPDANYCNSQPGGSPDTFTYTLNGGSTATVSVTVTCVADPPTAVNDSATVLEDSGATTIDVLANDVKPDGTAAIRHDHPPHHRQRRHRKRRRRREPDPDVRDHGDRGQRCAGRAGEELQRTDEHEDHRPRRSPDRRHGCRLGDQWVHADVLGRLGRADHDPGRRHDLECQCRSGDVRLRPAPGRDRQRHLLVHRHGRGGLRRERDRRARKRHRPRRRAEVRRRSRSCLALCRRSGPRWGPGHRPPKTRWIPITPLPRR
jgi:Bacterial cadherin-like domain